MSTSHAQLVTRLIPTAVGLMYAQATPVGVCGLASAGVARAGTGFGDDYYGDDDNEDNDDEAIAGPDADESSAGPAGADASAGPAADEANRHLDRLTGQLDDYFDGQLRDFTVPVDWIAAGVESGFSREVYLEIQHIPYGETTSYGQISMDAGRPRNARRVGRLCSLVPVSFLIPVHRVTRADGGLGSCPEFRRHLLAHEKRNIDSGEPVAITPA